MFGSAITLGFWLSEDGLEASLVRVGRKTSKRIADTTVAGDALLSGDDRPARLANAFRACVKALPRTVRRADTPAVLAVPDSLVVEDVFRFDDFPKAEAEARALVAHRLSREINIMPDDIDVSWEEMEADGARIVRVRAMARSLRQDIEAGAAAAGLRLVRIDGWAGFASAAPEVAKRDAGAAVWCDGHEWSLLCWGGADACGFSQTGSVEAPDVTASDIVRLSLAYARRNEVAPGPLTADVPASLASALSESAKRLGLEALALPADKRATQVAKWA